MKVPDRTPETIAAEPNGHAAQLRGSARDHHQLAVKPLSPQASATGRRFNKAHNSHLPPSASDLQPATTSVVRPCTPASTPSRPPISEPFRQNPLITGISFIHFSCIDIV